MQRLWWKPKLELAGEGRQSGKGEGEGEVYREAKEITVKPRYNDIDFALK